MTQNQAEKLFDEWMRNGKIVVSGCTYRKGVNDYSAVRAMIPTDLKMVGKLSHMPSLLTLTNTDLDELYHVGFTIGEKGHTMYWNLVWNSYGNCVVYPRHGGGGRWLSGDTVVCVHFKQQYEKSE